MVANMIMGKLRDALKDCNDEWAANNVIRYGNCLSDLISAYERTQDVAKSKIDRFERTIMSIFGRISAGLVICPEIEEEELEVPANFNDQTRQLMTILEELKEAISAADPYEGSNYNKFEDVPRIALEALINLKHIHRKLKRAWRGAGRRIRKEMKIKLSEWDEKGKPGLLEQQLSRLQACLQNAETNYDWNSNIIGTGCSELRQAYKEFEPAAKQRLRFVRTSIKVLEGPDHITDTSKKPEDEKDKSCNVSIPELTPNKIRLLENLVEQYAFALQAVDPCNNLDMFHREPTEARSALRNLRNVHKTLKKVWNACGEKIVEEVETRMKLKKEAAEEEERAKALNKCQRFDHWTSAKD